MNTIIVLIILGDSDAMTKVELEDTEEQPIAQTGSLSLLTHAPGRHFPAGTAPVPADGSACCLPYTAHLVLPDAQSEGKLKAKNKPPQHSPLHHSAFPPPTGK